MASDSVQFIQPSFLFPLVVGSSGGLALSDREETVRQLLLQVLFTSPGERVMRPDFGVGVMELAFEPNSQFLASRVRRRLERNVHDYLSETVEITSVEVRAEDDRLLLRIGYEIPGLPQPPAAMMDRRLLEVAIPRLDP